MRQQQSIIQSDKQFFVVAETFLQNDLQKYE